MDERSARYQAIDEYLTEIIQKSLTGEAGEHAYRVPFEKLIKTIVPSLTNVVNDPKRSQFGAPDFVFLRKGATVGYAETKDLGVKLDKSEKTEQLERYFGYSNLILSNYLEFRFFKNGIAHGEPVSIGTYDGKTITPHPEAYDRLAIVLLDTLSLPGTIKSGEHLAKIMAMKARRIRDNVRLYLSNDQNEQNIELLKIFNVIKTLLVKDLKIDQFADLYAQTLVYGLFIARYYDQSPESFSRQEARDLVPRSNPFLRDFFDHVAGASFDQRLGWAVDELCETFRAASVHSLMHEFYKIENLWGETSESSDPIIHFYEDFLKEYDPKQRFELGVFYTPMPVVKFIVESVDDILKNDFGIVKGIADDVKIGSGVHKDLHRVQILDPAVGTGTFLREVVQFIKEKFSGQEGLWPGYVEKSLLPRLNGFELMMASYIIAHLKLGMTLADSGYDGRNTRLRVFLTNSLEEAPEAKPTLFSSIGLQESLTKEALEAGNIKRDLPVMVIIGNPPYSAISQNNGEWITRLIDDYKKVAGVKINERKHWLNDDYVKFIRFAEHFVERNKEGVIGMITNHGYLDNPTFRGMRWHLLNTFDSIYVLDLHGNAKKKETTKNGGKDENVFDIQQGVSILLAVKTGKKGKGFGKVYRYDLYGLRAEKYSFLNKNSCSSVRWEEVIPDEPDFVFASMGNKDLKKEYQNGFALNDLFINLVSGIVSARDNLVVDQSKEKLLSRIMKFSDPGYSDDEIRKEFFSNRRATGKYLAGDTRGWKMTDARLHIAGENHTNFIKRILYRPFDTRWIYYHSKMVDWGREKVMSNFLDHDNLGLVFEKIIPAKNATVSIAVTNSLIDAHITGSQSYCAPLYIYEGGKKLSNFNLNELKKIQKRIGSFSDEDLFSYIYAVLHSSAYRAKYDVYLKTNFPRIAYPKNREEFDSMVAFGRQLIELHLENTESLNVLGVRYPERGTNEVKRVKRDGQKVWINENQYFEGVADSVWNYLVGSIFPMQKWLKERVGHALSNEEIVHYERMAKIIQETLDVIERIDQTVSY